MSDSTTMDCDEALRLLAAFLDDELPADALASVDRHLDRCRSCFSRVEFERRLKGEIARLGREAVTPGFEERIRRLLADFTVPAAGTPTDGGPA
jgi:anti-sigma factor (TIGR02949 family)